MSEQTYFCGVPIKWIDKLETAPPKTYWLKHPSKMTPDELRMLAWLLLQVRI